MSLILFVRVKADLEFDELERRVLERKPAFLEVPGFAVPYPLRGDVGPVGV